MSVFSVSLVAQTGLILRHLFIFLSGGSHIFTENYHSLFLSLLSRFGFSSSLDNSLSPKLLLFLIAAAQMCAVLDNRTLTDLQLQLSAPICDSYIDRSLVYAGGVRGSIARPQVSEGQGTASRLSTFWAVYCIVQELMMLFAFLGFLWVIDTGMFLWGLRCGNTTNKALWEHRGEKD